VERKKEFQEERPEDQGQGEKTVLRGGWTAGGGVGATGRQGVNHGWKGKGKEEKLKKTRGEKGGAHGHSVQSLETKNETKNNENAGDEFHTDKNLEHGGIYNTPHKKSTDKGQAGMGEKRIDR